MPASLVYYITAHGFGHGTRSTDIIRAFSHLRPDITVNVVSDLPRSFLANRLPRVGALIRAGSLDVGMVQIDSIRVDMDASLARAVEFCSRWEQLIDHEVEFLAASGAGIVVSDIAAIPLQAASRLGLPGIAVGNFGWDWIYAEYIDRDRAWETVVQKFARGYAESRLLLRLPFHEEMRAFPVIEDIPLLSLPGRDRRSDIAALTGCDPSRRWVLLSFTTLGWDDAALSAVEAIDGYDFFTVLPLSWNRRNLHALDRDRVPFNDIVASVDYVISKPGYGILSDCIVNRKPLLFAERSDFREYRILEDAIRKYARSAHIPAGQLYQGDLVGALDRLRAAPEPPLTLPAGGGAIAARRIIELGCWSAQPAATGGPTHNHTVTT